MNELFEWLVTAEDTHQPATITRLMKAIIAIVFFAERANANEWRAIYVFAPANEEPLRNYLELPGEIPPMTRYSGYGQWQRWNTLRSFGTGGI
jgi:nucleoside recognition membrane protein YjiH